MNYKNLHGKSSLKHQDKIYPHNSLLAHMLAVAACAKVIFEHPQNNKRLQQNGFSNSTALIFIAALHDIGKCSRLFQRLVKNPAFNEIPYGQAKEWKHGVAGYVHYSSLVKLAIEQLSGFNQMQSKNLIELLFAACGHHGKYPDDPAHSSDEPSEETSAIFQLINDLIKLFKFEQQDFPINPASNSFIHWFAGWVVLADWLGSDSDVFKPVTCDKLQNISYEQLFQKYVLCAQQRVAELNLFIQGNKIYAKSVPNMFASKFAASGSKLNQMQAWATEHSLSDGKNIIICEVPMGAGKTEFAEIIAARMIAEGRIDGMVFALPTQGSANQIHSRLDEDLSRPIFQLPCNLAHANAKWEKLTTQESGQFGNDSQQDISNWFYLSNKRCFLAPISVVTVDQVELAVLNCKHSFLRAAAISRHLVVIDEIHAYDAYMSELIQQTLAYLGKMGTPVILLSATLPDKARNNLLMSYWGDNELTINTATYPRITWATAGADKAQCLHLEKQSAPVPEVKISRITDAMLDNEVLEKAKEHCVCIICNSVNSAITRFNKLKKLIPSDNHIEISLFHARFIRQHRNDKEFQVRQLFDKDSKQINRRSKILIATQVVEQSLDLDFDFLYTELAPIDLLLQRMGRLHRHVRTYRTFKPCLTVILPENDETSWFEVTQKIYVHRELLTRSQQFIEMHENLILPKDIGSAVASVYHELHELPEELKQQSKAANRRFNFSSDQTLSKQIEDIDESSNTRDAADSIDILLLMQKDNKFVLPNQDSSGVPSPIGPKGKISPQHLQTIHPYIISISDSNPKNPDTLIKKLCRHSCNLRDIWPGIEDFQEYLPYQFLLIGEYNDECHFDWGKVEGWFFHYSPERGLVWER